MERGNFCCRNQPWGSLRPHCIDPAKAVWRIGVILGPLYVSRKSARATVLWAQELVITKFKLRLWCNEKYDFFNKVHKSASFFCRCFVLLALCEPYVSLNRKCKQAASWFWSISHNLLHLNISSRPNLKIILILSCTFFVHKVWQGNLTYINHISLSLGYG